MQKRVAKTLRENLLKILQNRFHYFKPWDVTLLPKRDFLAVKYYLINIVKLSQWNILNNLGMPRMHFFIKLKGLAINLLNRLVGGFFLSDPHTLKAILMKIVNLSLILEDPVSDYMPFRLNEMTQLKTQMIAHERERNFITVLPDGFIQSFMEIEDKKRDILSIYDWLEIARVIPEPFAGIPFSTRLLDAFINNTDGNIYLGNIADLLFVQNMLHVLKHDLDVISNYMAEEKGEFQKKQAKVIFVTKWDCPHCKDVESILGIWLKLIKKRVDLVVYDVIDIENVFYANAIYVRHIPALLHAMFLVQGIKRPENPFWWKAFVKKGKELVNELKQDWEAVKKKAEHELFTNLFRGLPISMPNLEEQTARMFMDKVFPPPSWRVVKMIYYNINKDLRASPRELLEVARSNIVLPREEETPSKPRIVKIKEIEIDLEEVPDIF